MFAVKTLSLPEIRSIYTDHVTRDFPPDERKPMDAIETAYARGEYQCFGAFEEDSLAAYAFFVRLRRKDETLYLFDYLAVLPEKRDQGVGSRFLQALMADALAAADCVLLEVEHPDYAEIEDERALRLRRLAFYLRNGLTDTGVSARVYHVEFRILSLPVGKPRNPAEMADIYRALYRAVMPRWIYDKMVEIPI